MDQNEPSKLPESRPLNPFRTSDNPFRGSDFQAQRSHDPQRSNVSQVEPHYAPQQPESHFVEQAPAPSQPAGKFQGLSGLLTSNAYLPEYLLMLLSLGTVLAAINALIGYGIDSLGGSSAADASSPFGAIGMVSMTLSLSSLFAFLPLFIVLYIRTRGSELQTPQIRAHRWRKGFLGGFIVLQVLGIAYAISALAFNVISRVLPAGDFSSAYGATEDPVWKPIVTTLITVALTGFVIWVVTRHYKQSGDK